MCINHADDEAKREGMLNIGAAQKSARQLKRRQPMATLSWGRSMLVLWDPSYAEQLWPVYEMANFLRRLQTSVKKKSFHVISKEPRGGEDPSGHPANYLSALLPLELAGTPGIHKSK